MRDEEEAEAAAVVGGAGGASRREGGSVASYSAWFYFIFRVGVVGRVSVSERDTYAYYIYMFIHMYIII